MKVYFTHAKGKGGAMALEPESDKESELLRHLVRLTRDLGSDGLQFRFLSEDPPRDLDDQQRD